MATVIDRCMGADVPAALRGRLDKPLAHVRDAWVVSLAAKERPAAFSRLLLVLAKADRTDARAAHIAGVLARMLQHDTALFGHWQLEYERLAKDTAGFADYAAASVQAVRLMETPAGGAGLVPRRAVRDVVQAFTAVNQAVLAGKQGKAAKRPAAQQVERCDKDMKAYLGTQRSGGVRSLVWWLVMALLTSAGVLRVHKHCKANPCTSADPCHRLSPCRLITDYNLGPHLDKAAALADEQYAAYLEPLEPYTEAAYQAFDENVAQPLRPHVDAAWDATHRMYMESVHPVVEDGYGQAARYYTDSVAPHVDEAWRQAQPHIDAAAKFYDDNVHPGVMAAYDTAIEYGSHAAEWTNENVVKPGVSSCGQCCANP
jgi:hypothetical protein